MLLLQVCREQNFGSDVCANLSSHTEAQTSVQEEVSTINMYLELLTNIPAVFFVLFLGSWSDKHGRKIPMLLPSCGSLIATLVLLVRSPTIDNIFLLISSNSKTQCVINAYFFQHCLLSE